MIAANYVRHPEMMRFQRELWSKSKRDSIIFRIAGLIMRGSPVPAWVKDARQRAKQLADAVRSACRDWIAEQGDCRQPRKDCAMESQHTTTDEKRRPGRPRKYASAAERQAAYRERHGLVAKTVHLPAEVADAFAAYMERHRRDGAGMTESQVLAKLIAQQLCRKR
jgi:hypothetical protein